MNRTTINRTTMNSPAMNDKHAYSALTLVRNGQSLMRGLILWSGICGAAMAVPHPVDMSSVSERVSWQQAFAHDPSVPSLTLTATYLDGQGTPHHLVLTRQSDRWLHRQTDGKLDVFARSGLNGTTEYRLIDHDGKRVIDSERTSLYKVGIFMDWQHLSTGLSQPQQSWQLQRMHVEPETTSVPCQWVQASDSAHPDSTIHSSKLSSSGESDHQGAHRFQLCWSASLNALIALRAEQADGHWVNLYQVNHLQLKKVVSSWPAIPDGFQYQNVDRDLEAD